MPLIGMSMIGANYIQSIGNAKQAMFLSLLRQVLLLVPMMLILPKFLGLKWYLVCSTNSRCNFIYSAFVVVRREVLSHRDKNKDVESVA